MIIVALFNREGTLKMAGGLMQLISTGSQDQYLVVAPEMSYFKQVYKRHTNFSMQSVRVEFQNKFYLDSSERTFDCEIPRFGDMLKEVMLCIKLPNIYSNDTHRFRWIKNFGNYLLREYYVRIGTQEIDHRWGEWMDVWNELALSYDQKVSFDTLTGNTQEYMNPKALSPMVTIKNNKISYSYYPASTGPSSPSLTERTVFIPLDFWFTKNTSLALPIIALQYQTPTVTIRLRSIDDLYQVWDIDTSMYVSPARYNSMNPTLQRVSMSTFTKFGGGGSATLYLEGYLECNFIFLDTAERTFIAATSFDYLVERVTRIEKTGVKTPDTTNLVLTNPVKELIWFYRRRDANLYNDWTNFTASQPEDSLKPPLLKAQFLWNGIARIDEKPSEYFNILQPHMHHTSTPRQGIYAYSFSLVPEKVQPSGSFNASVINTVQLVSSVNDPVQSTLKEYDLVVYALQYNVFRVNGGSGGMVFNL